MENELVSIVCLARSETESRLDFVRPPRGMDFIERKRFGIRGLANSIRARDFNHRDNNFPLSLSLSFYMPASRESRISRAMYFSPFSFIKPISRAGELNGGPACRAAPQHVITLCYPKPRKHADLFNSTECLRRILLIKAPLKFRVSLKTSDGFARAVLVTCARTAATPCLICIGKIVSMFNKCTD